MTKEVAKKWAELFAAYAEGKPIELFSCDCSGKKSWNTIFTIDTYINVDRYRIKPEPITRIMNHQELSDWLIDCPQEHREYKLKGMITVRHNFTYCEGNEFMPCEDILIRKNHDKWMEPIIEVKE